MRNTIAFDCAKSLAKFGKVRIGDWKVLRMPPTLHQVPQKNRYIPLSKRFLFRELISDASVVSPSLKESLEDVAMFIDEKIADQYHLKSEESMLLFQPLMDAKVSLPSSADAFLRGRSPMLSRKERLDSEYWFLRQLEDIAPSGGFSEVSQEVLQSACIPRPSRSSQVKTYVDPADYDVLRVWTRGLHPACMYPLDRSLKQRPAKAMTIPTISGGSITDSEKRQGSRIASLKQWGERLINLVGPKTVSLVPADHLCFNHVLLAYRLKGDNALCLRMLKHVPVSSAASGNAFAEGVVDILPAHRFMGLSQGARGLVVTTSAVTAVGLSFLTLLAFLFTDIGSTTSEAVLTWCLGAVTTAGGITAVVALRYWRARAEWSERLRKLSLVCESNSGGFALAHFLGLVQAELFKSALLVYTLLLQPSECKIPLKRSQLEVRAESWVANRLSPRGHIGLPASAEARVSFPHRFRRDRGSSNTTEVFTGGSGPSFDLQFDAGPALTLLRYLNLVRGSDEEGLEVTTMRPLVVDSCERRKRLSAFLSPEYQEDDLGFPQILIRQ
ncbi:unnamed protein product [Taenia asiatica]|uniref:Transmembrane protein n=1 Tax=Taenia asiatica TaxID=60517 RepID=A0A0R3WDR9_TAEAS|nr:unnamed protein product [Taenia asiatica]